jgi:exodeoxyribonuclease VII large subunit
MRLDDRQRSLVQALSENLRRSERDVASLETRLRGQDPKFRIALLKQRLDDSLRRLRARGRTRMREVTLKLDKLDGQLQALSPQAVLRRGYSITTLKKGGAVVRSIAQVKPGDVLTTRVTDGGIESTAEDRSQPKLFD